MNSHYKKDGGLDSYSGKEEKLKTTLKHNLYPYEIT